MIIVLSATIACFIAYTLLLLLAILERDRLIKILRSQLRDAEARMDCANEVARKECQIAQKLQCQLDAEKIRAETAIRGLSYRDKSGKFAKRGATK